MLDIYYGCIGSQCGNVVFLLLLFALPAAGWLTSFVIVYICAIFLLRLRRAAGKCWTYLVYIWLVTVTSTALAPMCTQGIHMY